MPLGHPSPSGPIALLVSGDPERFRDTATAFSRRGVLMRFAQDDRGVTRALAKRPWLVLVDLTHRAVISDRTIEHINRLRGRALVVALHSGSLDSESLAFSELSVDGYCRADAGGPASLATYTAWPVGLGSQSVH